ncbi:MAG: mandelate racemase/muconate lactonizing enzyme family protein [Luteitalea sp.]|nr:mandelate racemase/muconate lactonizing enzyme family protein [Luteitalea sp.]
MRINRRSLLAGLSAGVSATALGVRSSSAWLLPQAEERVVPDYETPLFDLRRRVDAPVKIESIELLKNGSHYFVRTRSTDGAVGVCKTKQVADYVPILLNLVAPFFLGKDARDLETLIDGVYIQNYKLAGQALWCPVAYVEQSLFDLLGKTASKPIGELMGGVIRKEIPVYLSGSGRDTTAEEEVDVYVRGVEHTGAKAVKFKIGGRMSRNLDAYPDRTETMMALARKRLGDDIDIYTDANGSYNAAKAIEIGHMLEDLGVGFFEEPCPWEELSETKQVADALTMQVAAGEQDASLWRFQWMMENGVMDIVQPDLNYNGGFIRAARVARMARRFEMRIVPHNTQTGATAVNILQFASAIPNIGAYMEFPWRAPRKPESWYSPHFEIHNGTVKVPTGPGLGVEIDADFLAKAETVGPCPS